MREKGAVVAQPRCAKGTSRAAVGGIKGSKRGNRRSAENHVEIWTANTSGKPQLEMTVKEATRARKEGRNVVAMLNQEHQQGASRAQDLQHWGKREGEEDREGWLVRRNSNSSTQGRSTGHQGRLQGRPSTYRSQRSHRAGSGSTRCPRRNHGMISLCMAHRTRHAAERQLTECGFRECAGNKMSIG